MVADPKTGGRFEPSAVTAKQGDVVKFTLVSGAHNVHFLPEKNPGVTLPNASDILQLPGQSYELVIGAKPGTYNFQCDPHAALGMVGTITVQ
jgi:plastocyanin